MFLCAKKEISIEPHVRQINRLKKKNDYSAQSEKVEEDETKNKTNLKEKL